MTNQIHPFSRKNLLILATVVVLVTVSFIWARTRPATGERNLSVAQAVPSYKQRLRFWIHGDGIRPRIAHAKPGAVLLTCENKTLLDAELVVEQASSSQIVRAVNTIRVSSNLGRATQEVLLTPGDYVVYERSRPDMRASLIVSP